MNVRRDTAHATSRLSPAWRACLRRAPFALALMGLIFLQSSQPGVLGDLGVFSLILSSVAHVLMFGLLAAVLWWVLKPVSGWALLIAVVVAGILIGNHGARLAMSEKTREHINSFWSLIDEILNSVLFMLIGFEVIALSFSPNIVGAAVLAIPLALISRFVAVATPVSILRLRLAFSPGVIPILTWGGLRGGISVALALSLPPTPEREILLVACYAVVIFSIIVQGLTMAWVVRRYADEAS